MAAVSMAVGASAYLGGAAIQGIIGAAMGKCVSSPLISVGCGSDSKISVDTTTITNIVKNTIMKNVVNVEQENIVYQTFKVNLFGVKCTNININQTVNIKSTLNANITSNVTSDMKSEVQALFNEKIANLSSSELDMLAPQGSQNSKSDITKFIQTAINDTFSLQNLNAIKQKLIVVQTGEINISNTVCENLTITQDLVVDILCQAVAFNLVNNIMSAQDSKTIQTQLENDSKNVGKGLNSIVDSIMSMLKTYGLIAGLIVVALIIGFVLFTKYGGLSQIKELQYYF